MVYPMELYDKIKAYGSQAKADADAFIQNLTKNYTADNPAPPEEIQRGLEGILAQYEAKSKAPVASGFSEKAPYAVGLAGILGGALALGAGVTAGLLGFLVAGAAAAHLYSKTPKESYKPA